MNTHPRHKCRGQTYMPRLAWLTDIHLNFLRGDDLERFLAEVAARAPDAVLITGDLAESRDVAWRLRRMEDAWQRPIYFVLGNHDFYRGSIAQTRRIVTQVAEESQRLVYLTAGGVVELTPTTALVGHDGWGDARLGNFDRSGVLLNDFLLVAELKKWDTTPDRMDREALRRELARLGDEAGRHFARVLPEALAGHRRMIVATHVPPFPEAAWYDGRPSDDDWLPFFASKASGDALREAAEAFPDREFLVLCGHTHGRGECRIGSNLYVRTGEARYGRPIVQDVIEVE